MIHCSALMLMLVEHMERYRVGFERAACTWCWRMFEFECVIAWYIYHTLSQLYTRPLFHYNGNEIKHTALRSAPMLILIEYTEHCRVG